MGRADFGFGFVSFLVWVKKSRIRYLSFVPLFFFFFSLSYPQGAFTDEACFFFRFERNAEDKKHRPMILSEFTGSYSYSSFRSCLPVNPVRPSPSD